MQNPFLLPLDREELMKRLSVRGSPHGDMMTGLGRKPPAGDEAQKIWRSLLPREGRPLVLYVHVPFCVSRCSFCGFYRNRVDDAALESYTQRLLAEITRTADEGVFTRKSVEVVYFGGGTPTALTADQLRRIVSLLHERFNIAPDCEFTVEGRLFAFDDERVRACLETGVNRFSFGIQSFETDLRRSLGRRLSREETLSRLERIKEICGDKIALIADLIYGLPGQTQEDWMKRNVMTVHEDSVLDGVDLYSLKIVSGMSLEKRLEKEGRWSEEERARRHAEASDYLAEKGWKQLSTTHWARNSLERNRYNTYAKIGVDMVPFGCGAGGFIGGWSVMQEMDLEKYQNAVDAGLKPIGTMMADSPMRSDAIRFTRQTDLGFFDPTEIPETDFSPILDNWTDAGVWRPALDISPTAFRLTRLGEYYQVKLNSILTGFHMASRNGMTEMMR